MYDSTTAGDIPAGAGAIAGYDDGTYAWSPAAWARFAHVPRLTVTTRPGDNLGDILDCERGDATPADCPGWVRMRRASGLAKPGIYCSASTRPAVEAAMSTAGFVLGRDYWLWIAAWTGQPHPEPDASIVQYADPATSGGHFDLSIVYDPSVLEGAPSTTPTFVQRGAPVALDFGPVPIVSVCCFTHPTLGAAAAAVGPDGSVYCSPANAHLGGMNGDKNFIGREAAHIEGVPGGYRIRDTAGEWYQLPKAPGA